jgi:predicted DNA binding CopG/RHH family protein
VGVRQVLWFLEAYEKGQLIPSKVQTNFQEIARNTMRKSKKINIRISDNDLSSLQRRAAREGIPYQTLKGFIWEGKMYKLSKDEKDLLDSVERGNWKRVSNFEKEKRDAILAARATLRKDKRVNIRISQNDLDYLQKRAYEEGIPYQTLMSSVLHKFAHGKLKAA